MPRLRCSLWLTTLAPALSFTLAPFSQRPRPSTTRIFSDEVDDVECAPNDDECVVNLSDEDYVDGAGALEVNPDIYVPEAEEIVADESEFHLPASGMTDLDFEMKFAHTSVGELKIDVRPVAMTFEEFYVGFTPDSHPAFSVTPTEGRMERRNGPPTELTVTCNPEGKTGELEAHLCFILPEEKAFSTFYKITAKPF